MDPSPAFNPQTVPSNLHLGQGSLSGSKDSCLLLLGSRSRKASSASTCPRRLRTYSPRTEGHLLGAVLLHHLSHQRPPPRDRATCATRHSCLCFIYGCAPAAFPNWVRDPPRAGSCMIQGFRFPGVPSSVGGSRGTLSVHVDGYPRIARRGKPMWVTGYQPPQDWGGWQVLCFSHTHYRLMKIPLRDSARCDIGPEGTIDCDSSLQGG